MNLILPDSGATAALGERLAAAFPGAGSGPCVLHLHGELGAGKTTCARSLLVALGVRGLVRSPTYTLVEAYAARGMTCVHIDLYRLRSADELEDLGVRDYWQAGHLILVEWPERGGAAMGTPDLALRLSYAAVGRRAELVAPTPAGEVWLQRLASDTRLIPYLSNLT